MTYQDVPLLYASLALWLELLWQEFVNIDDIFHTFSFSNDFLSRSVQFSLVLVCNNTPTFFFHLQYISDSSHFEIDCLFSHLFRSEVWGSSLGFSSLYQSGVSDWFNTKASIPTACASNTFFRFTRATFEFSNMNDGVQSFMESIHMLWLLYSLIIKCALVRRYLLFLISYRMLWILNKTRFDKGFIHCSGAFYLHLLISKWLCSIIQYL